MIVLQIVYSCFINIFFFYRTGYKYAANTEHFLGDETLENFYKGDYNYTETEEQFPDDGNKDNPEQIVNSYYEPEEIQSNEENSKNFVIKLEREDRSDGENRETDFSRTDETASLNAERRKRSKRWENNTSTKKIMQIMKENRNLRKMKLDTKHVKTDMDETDMFFLSMSRMTKKLSLAEQARIKLMISSTVLEAEMKSLRNETDNYSSNRSSNRPPSEQYFHQVLLPEPPKEDGMEQ